MSSSIENWSPSAQQTFKFLKKCKCWKQKTSTVTRTLLYQTYLCFCTMFFHFFGALWGGQRTKKKPESQAVGSCHRKSRKIIIIMKEIIKRAGRSSTKQQHKHTTWEITLGYIVPLGSAIFSRRAITLATACLLGSLERSGQMVELYIYSTADVWLAQDIELCVN